MTDKYQILSTERKTEERETVGQAVGPFVCISFDEQTEDRQQRRDKQKTRQLQQQKDKETRLHAGGADSGKLST